MKYYLIAGEASGDLHGSNLMKSIKQLDPQAEFRFWGGNLMQEVSDNIVTHYKDVAFMGLIEVVKNLGLILSKIKECKKDIEAYNPDKLILIDYPGFNLKIAEWAHTKDIEISFYISPKIWAWKKKRGYKIKKLVDKLILILPFEIEVYKEFDMETHYVGHPLLDAVEQFEADPEFSNNYNLQSRKTLAVLPGSRVQEVEKILPVMGEAISALGEEYNLLLACTPHVPRAVYEKALAKVKGANIQYIIGDTYNILNVADAAMVSSGTATLETALFEVPQVVCYKTSNISYQVGIRLVDLDYMSLVNLIMDQEVVVELLQHQLTSKRLQEELRKIMAGPARNKMIEEYKELRAMLGHEGASLRAAEVVVS